MVDLEDTLLNLNLLKIVEICFRSQHIVKFVNMLCIFWNNVHSAIAEYNTLCMSIGGLLIMLLNPLCPSWFLSIYLSVTKNVVWKFPTMNVNVSISSYISVKFCFIYFEAVFLAAYNLALLYISGE